jgi:apolipoprotein N-acyltransferase
MNQIRLLNHKWGMSLLASILLALSFPPFNLSVLQIPAIFLLLRVTVLSDGNREAILYIYPSFILWNLFSTYWLMMATVAGGVAAILANALIMVVPFIVIRSLFLREINPIVSSLLAASVWVSYEFLHHNWDLAWPWLTLGNAWSNHIAVIQFISFTGVLGISFWVFATASMLFHLLQNRSKSLLIGSAIFFLVFPGFSLYSYITTEDFNTGEAINVVIVQPNSDSYQSNGGFESNSELITHLLKLSENVLTDSSDVIIWPENALDTSVQLGSSQLSRIRDSLRVWNTPLITGSGYIDFFDEPSAPKVVRKTRDGRMYNVFNAALALSPTKQTEIYKKGRLVPIVERFPFVVFFQSIDLFGWFDWGSISGYGKGGEPTLFEVDGNQTPALICYDSVFPGWVNRFVDEGAGFLTIITNDGWWGDSHGHIQHFAYARLRAIEHRMWIARSANNGISGIISPDGKIQFETEYWTEDAFSYRIYTNSEKTFYSRYGEWFGYVMLILTLSGLMFIAFKKKQNSYIGQ